MGEASGTDETASVRSPWGGPAAAYGFGLGAMCLLGWLAYLAFATAVPAGTRLMVDGGAGLSLIWVVPAVYLAAWQILSWRNPRLAVLGAFVTAMMSLVTFYAAWFLGFFTLGLLAMPVGMLGVFLICVLLRELDRSEARAGENPTALAMHAATLIFAMFVMMQATGHLGGDGGRFDRDAAGPLLALGVLMFAFAPHGVATWVLGPRRVPRRWLARRAASFIAAIWTGMAVVLSVTHPVSASLLWPFRMAELQAPVQEEVAIFRSAGDRVIGFAAGATYPVRIGNASMQATVPDGWLGSLGWNSPTRRGPQGAVALIPDPRRGQPGDTLIRKITVRGRPTLTELRRPEAISEVRHPGLWRAVGCRQEGEGENVLTACRAILARPGGLLPIFPVSRIPLETMTSQVILNGTGDGPFFFGAGMAGTCRYDDVCNLWFPARGGLALWVELPGVMLPRWRAARDRAFSVVREAAGIEPEGAPAWNSLDGALMSPP